MSTSHTQWTDVSASQENKRRSVASFVEPEDVGEEGHVYMLCFRWRDRRNQTEGYQKCAMSGLHQSRSLRYNASVLFVNDMR